MAATLNPVHTSHALDHVPGLRHLREQAYRRHFAENRDDNLFYGLYDSFDAAARDAPGTRPLGYDNAASAELYLPCLYPHDYPALFWLSRSMDDGLRRIFDLGGHIGLKYFAFRRVLPYPADLHWTVCDVPAVVARGRDLAAARDPDGHLTFTTDPLDATGHEVLYLSGSLQYLPQRLGDLLPALHVRPRRIVLNLTPVHPTQGYITLNSIGTAICPYRVMAREDLLHELCALGYVKRDEWENTGKRLSLPLTTGLDLDHYTGFCFDLAA